MKKILIVISFILILSLSGCSGTEKAGQATQIVEPEITEPVIVVADDAGADLETLLVESEGDGCDTYCPSFINHYCGPVEGGTGYVVTDYTTETDENCECIVNVQEGECALCDDRGEYCLEAEGVLE